MEHWEGWEGWSIGRWNIGSLPNAPPLPMLPPLSMLYPWSIKKGSIGMEDNEGSGHFCFAHGYSSVRKYLKYRHACALSALGRGSIGRLVKCLHLNSFFFFFSHHIYYGMEGEHCEGLEQLISIITSRHNFSDREGSIGKISFYLSYSKTLFIITFTGLLLASTLSPPLVFKYTSVVGICLNKVPEDMELYI